MGYFIVIGLVVVGVIAWFWLKEKPEGGSKKETPRQSSGWRDFEIISKQEGRLKQGINYLEKNKKITNAQYREMVGVTARQAVRDLDELEKQGIVEQVGKTGHAVKYKLK